ncbi:MAG: A/G-specific adenine glycosylase [Parvularculales bacterium]
MSKHTTGVTGGKGAHTHAQLVRWLLDWYGTHQRSLPWRVPLGVHVDPYRIWLSEVMLQQTTVVTVIPYYQRFLERWPTIENLAAASVDDVLAAWAGLGYYARARNLHRCAQTLMTDYGGRFPDTEEALRTLPGIGTYTAAAIAAIAFDRPATAVDGNVERVMARFYGVETPLPKAKRELAQLAKELTPTHRSGEFAQAMMELGALVCTPKQPLCEICPWHKNCEAQRTGRVLDLPHRFPKPTKPTRYGVAFWVERADGAVMLRRRPDHGLLGGMMELPGTPWMETIPSETDVVVHAPVKARWRRLTGWVQHTFTHFHLEIEARTTSLTPRTTLTLPDGAMWVQQKKFDTYALPTLMRKVIGHALAQKEK